MTLKTVPPAMRGSPTERLFALVEYLARRAEREAARCATFAQLDHVRARYLGKHALCNRVLRAMWGETPAEPQKTKGRTHHGAALQTPTPRSIKNSEERIVTQTQQKLKLETRS